MEGGALEVPACSICLEYLLVDLAATSCGHVFHLNWQFIFKQDKVQYSRMCYRQIRMSLGSVLVVFATSLSFEIWNHLYMLDLQHFIEQTAQITGYDVKETFNSYAYALIVNQHRRLSSQIQENCKLQRKLELLLEDYDEDEFSHDENESTLQNQDQEANINVISNTIQEIDRLQNMMECKQNENQLLEARLVEQSKENEAMRQNLMTLNNKHEELQLKYYHSQVELNSFKELCNENMQLSIYWIEQTRFGQSMEEQARIFYEYVRILISKQNELKTYIEELKQKVDEGTRVSKMNKVQQKYRKLQTKFVELQRKCTYCETELSSLKQHHQETKENEEIEQMITTDVSFQNKRSNVQLKSFFHANWNHNTLQSRICNESKQVQLSFKPPSGK